MDRRLLSIQKIQCAFAYIIARIKTANKHNFTDINIVAEDFFKTLFNLVYGYDLKNANAIKQNESSIDLYYDAEKIAYQITSQNKPNKISHTVDSFIKDKKFNSYTKLIIFSITDQDKCKSDALEKLSEYDVGSNYINVSDFEKEIFFSLDTDKLELIAEYLEEETSPLFKKKAHTFTKVDDSLKSLHIVEQLYTVVNYFNGFKSIYPRTLSKLYPFNLEKRTYDAYTNYCLKTNNKEIHELLNKVVVKPDTVEVLDESLKPFATKLKEIFMILNYSQVYCICYREKYTEIEHHKIAILKDNPDCNCNECRYQRFETQPLFASLKEKAIEHSENLVEALNEGYYLCKLGEHIKGWQILNSVAEKSNKKNEAVTHFLALHNCYAIYNFIGSPWWENEAKSILPKIEEIDLQNLLCSLKVPIVVRNELIRIKEDYHLNYSRERIEELVERAREIRILYASGGYSSGASIHFALRQEMHLLFAFYSSNSIITDDFPPFKSTITKAVEGFFISYTTHERDEYRYKAFDRLVLAMMLFYVEEKALKRIFKTYEITRIEIEETEKKSFVQCINNFFASQFTKQTWTGAKFYADLNKQEYFSHYRQLLRHLFNRAMLILWKLNLTSEELKPLTQSFVDFLSAEKDLDHSSWKAIAKFLRTHIHAFDLNQIKSIIELAISDKKHRVGEDSFQEICKSVAEKSNFIITDTEFLVKIMQTLAKSCPSCNRIHDMALLLALWNITDKKGKAIIKKRAFDYLGQAFDARFFEKGVFLNVFTKKNKSFLKQYIIYGQGKCHACDIKEESGLWLVQNFAGYNFINCLAFLKVDFQAEKELQVIAQRSDYYNWLVNYETYDYSSFNFKWLTDACPYHIKINLYKVPSLKSEVAKELLRNNDKELGVFYIAYLLKETLTDRKTR